MFLVAGNEIDRSFTHCVLALESGHQKKGILKYCGGTTNLTYYLKSCQDGLGDVSSWICQSSYGYFSNLLLYLYHALQ